jgi:hypothetical protein
MSIVLMVMGITQKVFACGFADPEVHVVMAETEPESGFGSRGQFIRTDSSTKTLFFGHTGKVTQEELDKLSADKRNFTRAGWSFRRNTSQNFLKYSDLNKYLSPEHISFVESKMLHDLSGFIDIKIKRKTDGSYDEAIVVRNGKELMRINNRSPKIFKAYYESAPHSLRYESKTDGDSFESKEFSPTGKVERTVMKTDRFDRVIDFKNKAFACEPLIKGDLDANDKVSSVTLTGLSFPLSLVSRVRAELSTTKEVDCEAIVKDVGEFLTREMPRICEEDIGESLQNALTKIESHFKSEVNQTNATLSQKAGRLGEILSIYPDPLVRLGTFLFNQAEKNRTIKDIDSLSKQRDLLKELSVAHQHQMQELAKNRIIDCKENSAQNNSGRSDFKQIESSSKVIEDTKTSLANWQ